MAYIEISYMPRISMVYIAISVYMSCAEKADINILSKAHFIMLPYLEIGVYLHRWRKVPEGRPEADPEAKTSMISTMVVAWFGTLFCLRIFPKTASPSRHHPNPPVRPTALPSVCRAKVCRVWGRWRIYFSHFSPAFALKLCSTLFLADGGACHLGRTRRRLQGVQRHGRYSY